MLSGEPRSANITCVTDVVVCEISKDVMAKLFERNPNVTTQLSKAIAIRDLANKSALSENHTEENPELIEKETGIFLEKLKNFFGMKR